MAAGDPAERTEGEQVKTARKTTLGRKLRYAPRPSRKKSKHYLPPPKPTGIPLPAFTCRNFIDGRSITYKLTREGYRFQVQGGEAVQTEAGTYPEAAAIARRRYGLPAIGTQHFGGGA